MGLKLRNLLWESDLLEWHIPVCLNMLVLPLPTMVKSYFFLQKKILTQTHFVKFSWHTLWAGAGTLLWKSSTLVEMSTLTAHSSFGSSARGTNVGTFLVWIMSSCCIHDGENDTKEKLILKVLNFLLSGKYLLPR